MRHLLTFTSLLIISGCNAADPDAVIISTEGADEASAASEALTGPSTVTLNADGVMVINGVKRFPLGVTMPPPPEAMAPSGKKAFVELRSGGVSFMRTGPNGADWDSATIAREQQIQDAAAAAGLRTWLYLRQTPNVVNPGGSNEVMLRKLVTTFRQHPALLAYKGLDEPQWAGLDTYSIAAMKRGYDAIKALDKNHPVVIIQAPRGTVDELKVYNPVSDIQGTDIYPISYPPGSHSLGANKDLSMVGDYTQKMMAVANGSNNGTWMTLQIAWSGVVNPGKTLRMPTFFEERFMAYQAIINGARGLVFYGGHMEQAWTASDQNYGWAWNFWGRVLKPLLQELSEKSALANALVAPVSPLPVTVSQPGDVEFTVRETPAAVFVLACKRGPGTEEVTFRGLPAGLSAGAVLYESPRTVTAAGGAFSDWFAPHEVHVYRFAR